jgi:hypothetical protein
MPEPEDVDGRDETFVEANIRTVAKMWAYIYNVLIQEGIPDWAAIRIVEAYVIGMTGKGG